MFLPESRKSPATFKSHDEHVKLQEEINFEEDFATRTRLRKELEARLKSRSRATGTVQLIAELFNVEFINHRVMELCMRELLGESQEPTELDIECFHILMTTTGAKLEGHPVGAKIVEKFLGRLTEIMEKDPAKYSGKTRSSMLEVFQLRANGWKPPTKPEAAPESRPEPPKAVVKAAPKINKLLQEVKVSRILFKELNDVLHQLGPGEMIQFVHQFRKIKFQSEEQLQGAVKIVFERVMAASNWLSLLALVCKGLAVATAPAEGNNNNTVTFGRLLLSLIEQEIETQQQNSRIFRQICEKTKTLKSVRNAKKAHQMKEEIENDFKLQARAHRFTVFVGELFKADMVKSHFIFEYIAKLLHPETISSTSVESFCLLIHSTDRKLLQGRNEVDLLKHNIASLSEAMETVQLSWRALQMVKDLLDKCRVYFQILSNAGLTNEFSGFSRCELPWNSTFSEDVLWQEEMNETHVLVPIQQTNGIGEGVKPPPGSPPLNLIHRLPPPVSIGLKAIFRSRLEISFIQAFLTSLIGDT